MPYAAVRVSLQAATGWPIPGRHGDAKNRRRSGGQGRLEGQPQMSAVASRSATRDAYAVLQVRCDAAFEVVCAAVRALARRCHPDGQSPDLGRMAEISSAFAQPRSPEARARYDRDIEGASARSDLIPTAETGPRGPWACTHVRGDAQRREAPADSWAIPARPAPRDDVLDFGRYAGWTIGQVVVEIPDYLRWLSRHSSGVRFRDAIVRALGPSPEIGQRATAVG